MRYQIFCHQVNETIKNRNIMKDKFLEWLDSVIDHPYNIFSDECDKLQLKMLKTVRANYLIYRPLEQKHEVKKPLGIRPEFIVKEERLREINEGIDRYNKAFIGYPREWHVEKFAIIEWLDKYRSKVNTENKHEW